EVSARPAPMTTAPVATTIRGPKRSDRCPVTGPRKHHTSTVIENTAEVALRRAPNSAAIGLKNAPKLYATPYTAQSATNVAATIRHARGESNSSSDGKGSRDPAAPDPDCSVTAFMLEGGARSLKLLALVGIDGRIVQIQIFHCVNDRRGHHQPRVPFVIRRDDVPRRMRRRRVLDHFLVSGHVLGPSFAFLDIGG